MDKMLKIAVAGTGYVGLSIATLLAQHHEVCAIDVIPAKVDLINRRKSPIRDEYIEKYLAEKELKLTATLDPAQAYSGADLSSSPRPQTTTAAPSTLIPRLSRRSFSLSCSTTPTPSWSSSRRFPWLHGVGARKIRQQQHHIQPRVPARVEGTLRQPLPRAASLSALT